MEARLEARFAKLEAALSSKGEVPGGGGGGSRQRSLADAQGRCEWCKRTNCLMLSGGKPCREYYRGLTMMREAAALERKKREEAGGGGDDESES